MTKWLCSIAFCSAGLLALPNPAGAEDRPPVSFVDPLIGTSPNPFTKDGYSFDTGNVFPGAVCPRGMVAWSPDTTHAKQIAGGYWYPDSKIEDFSLTHFSGRGVPCLKDFAFMPLVGEVNDSPGTKWSQYAATFSHQNETATAGRYGVTFDNGISTVLTATARTGMARFTFPKAAAATLLVRSNGQISVHGNEVWGRADWKDNKPKIYFFAQFDRPIKATKTWVADRISDAATAEGAACGAVLTFDTAETATVSVRVGISYTSAENARANLGRENQGWDLDAVASKAAADWNHQLSRIEVGGGDEKQTKIFYTALYHCFMHPNVLEDCNGEYRGMDDKIHSVEPGHHQYQNIPAWDQHRSYSALMAILTRTESSDVMQSLVNYARQDASVRPTGGGLPRWEQVNTSSGGMVGDGDDTIIATSYAFGATQFDTRGALEAMEKGASQPGVTSDGHKVRDGLNVYLGKGFVPGNAAVTLEYCNDDFALARFARSLGRAEESAEFDARSKNWKKSFDPATGFIRPRLENGDWSAPITPTTDKGFVEGTASQYVWMVNCDLRSLVRSMGGNEKAVARLDKLFTKTNGGIHSEFAYMGNEPCEGVPWIYDFAAAPWRTQEVVRRIQTELFTDKPDGFPGNDDAGSLSSWYVFSALGLYPEVPGVAGFAVGSPIFPRAAVHLDDGKTIVITADHAAADSPFVQTLGVNGKSHESPWLPWAAVEAGGSLNFVLSAQPTQWGGDPAKGPPEFESQKKP